MTLLHTQRTAEPGTRNKENLLSLLQEGQDNVQRLSVHACLLERRLQGGAEAADLLVLVQDLKFAVEELQELFRSALPMAAPGSNGSKITKAEPAEEKPLRIEVVALRPLFTRCIEAVRQQARRTGVSLLCHLAPDLPSLTTDPETLAQIISLLLEYLVRTIGKGGLEVSVRWTEGTLVIDAYDAGRGISKETYAALRHLVGRLQGTLRVTQELGVQSRVELSFPSAPVGGNGAPHATPKH
ncbi:MAG: HAMP domain-containing histidine kinase [Deltaproteobacteria bacterium]|nr:HAMP domain-containing histidine kinase [Deltaproteobacteria bacterium]